jgi:uncharacterized protein (TIGR03067 family)
MKTTAWLVTWSLLLAAGSLAADGDKEDKADKFDAAKLVGTWTYVSAVKNGQKADADNIKDAKVTITKDTMTLEGGAGKFVMKYTLDTKKKPVTISMKMTEGAEGATAEGIIELKGDELKLCYATEGAAPKKFESKEGSDHRLVVLKRAKEAKDKDSDKAPAKP